MFLLEDLGDSALVQKSVQKEKMQIHKAEAGGYFNCESACVLGCS